MDFFSKLNGREYLATYAVILDWLFDDSKFDKHKWDNKNKVQAFTKAFHKIKGVSKNRIYYGAKKSICFPKKGSYETIPLFTFYLARGQSESKDLIRHIRNGIAHGNVNLHMGKRELIVELLDFGKESTCIDGQTAYMVFPLSFLNDIHSLYINKENQWGKTKNRKHKK